MLSFRKEQLNQLEYTELPRLRELAMIGRRRVYSVNEKKEIFAMKKKFQEIRDYLDIEDLDRSINPPTKPDPMVGSGYQLRHGNWSENIRKVSTGPFPTLGDQLKAVVQASTLGQKPDQRLYEVVEEARASGLSEGIGSEGGFLMQMDFSNQLLKSAFETGKLARRCLKIDVAQGKNGIDLPAFNETSRATGSRLGGIRGYWLGEGGTKLPSKPDFRMLDLQFKKLIGLCYTTDELLEDANVLEQVIRQGFADEFGFLVDEAIFEGTGAGQPQGILNASCLVTQDKEAGQVASTIVTENILNMYSRWCGNFDRGVWLVERSVLPQLYTMGIQVGLGGAPLFMPAGGISGKPYNTILGMPVEIIEQASLLGTVGDIVLADFGWFVLIDRPIQSASSIHVKFTTDETAFRFVLRIDGQPILASAITPNSSGSTVSPFVALETRD